MNYFLIFVSNPHLMRLTVMKKDFQKLNPRIISYRSCKHFSNETYKKLLFNNFSKEVFVSNGDTLQRFCCKNSDVLNKHEQRKKKHVGIIKCHLK